MVGLDDCVMKINFLVSDKSWRQESPSHCCDQEDRHEIQAHKDLQGQWIQFS